VGDGFGGKRVDRTGEREKIRKEMKKKKKIEMKDEIKIKKEGMRPVSLLGRF
jgi:hypothetical protein